MIVLGNPPFNKAEAIWDVCHRLYGDLVWIMPLRCYKTNDRYKYIENIEFIDAHSFDGSAIPDSLCIAKCGSEPGNVSFEDLLLESFDQSYRSYYEYNRIHDLKLDIKQIKYPRLDNLNRGTDFIESGRCCNGIDHGGSGYGSKGSCYKFNMTNEPITEKELTKTILYIPLRSKQAKINFCKWWYLGSKTKSLSSKTMIGLHMETVSNTCKYAIPQIDWVSISNNKYWKTGNYDEAILDVMGLNIC